MRKPASTPRYLIGMFVHFVSGSAGFIQRERSGLISARKFSSVSGWHYDVQVDGEGIWVIPEMDVMTE